MGFAQMGHICNQCGWGYPKPHPSAKQRRAHKKVCGKAEEPQDGQDGQGEDEQEVNKGEGVVNGEMGVEVMERQVSGKSEEDVFSDACNEFADLKGGNGVSSNFRSSDSPIQDSLSGALQVENDAQTEHHSSNSTFILDKQAKLKTSDTKEANGSPSDVPKDDHVDDIETFEDVDSHPYFVKDVDTEGDSESNGIPSAPEVFSSDSESRESEVVVVLQESESNKTQLDLPDTCSTSAITDGIVDSKESETDAPGQKMRVNESGRSEKVRESEDSFQVDATDGYNVKEVTESLHVLSKPAYLASEELSKETVKDYEEHVPVKSGVSETGAQNAISENIHPGFPLSKSGETASTPSLATRVHEDNRKSMVEEVSIENGGDIPEAKDVSEGPELHSADVIVSDGDAVEEIEKDGTTLEPEPRDSPQDASLKSVPQSFGLVAASDDNAISSEDALVNDPIDGVSRKDDTRHTPTTKDFPDRDEQYNRGGAIHENSAQRCTDSETSSYRSDLEECFQETNSKDINDSSAMLINTSEFDNTTEPASDSQNLHGENYLKSSKELEPAQAALFGADDAEKTAVEGSRPSTVHTVPAVLNFCSLEDEVLDLGMVSDVCSQRFMDTEDFLLEKQLEDMAVGLLDGSVDSFQQTDGHQRSSDIKGMQNPQPLHVSSLNMAAEHTRKVSDLTSPKTRAPLKAFLAEPNFDNKQEGTAQVLLQKSPTYKDGAESKALLHDDNGLNTSVDKEWDSPAKLPKHTQRRKSVFLPFLCCSSVN